jgi:hypothetical protein
MTEEITMPATSASAAKTDLSDLSAKLIAEVKAAFPGIELTQKKSYIRAHLGRTTVGYLYPSPNGGKSAVETIKPDGSGKYTYHRFAATGDLRRRSPRCGRSRSASAKAAAAAKKASK